MSILIKLISTILAAIPFAVIAAIFKTANRIELLPALFFFALFALFPIWRAESTDLKEPLLITLKLWAVYVASLVITLLFAIGSCFALIAGIPAYTIIGPVGFIVAFTLTWIFLYRVPKVEEKPQDVAPQAVAAMAQESAAQEAITDIKEQHKEEVYFIPSVAPTEESRTKIEQYQNDPVNRPNPDSGLEPLLETVLACNEEELKKLLANPALNVNLRHKATGNTALCVCALNGYESMAQLLLKHPDIDISMTNNLGKMAHDLAVDNGHYGVADLIEKRKK